MGTPLEEPCPPVEEAAEEAEETEQKEVVEPEEEEGLPAAALGAPALPWDDPAEPGLGGGTLQQLWRMVGLVGRLPSASLRYCSFWARYASRKPAVATPLSPTASCFCQRSFNSPPTTGSALADTLYVHGRFHGVFQCENFSLNANLSPPSQCRTTFTCSAFQLSGTSQETAVERPWLPGFKPLSSSPCPSRTAMG